MGQKEAKYIYKYITFIILRFWNFLLNCCVRHKKMVGGMLQGNRSLECSIEPSPFYSMLVFNILQTTYLRETDIIYAAYE